MVLFMFSILCISCEFFFFIYNLIVSIVFVTGLKGTTKGGPKCRSEQGAGQTPDRSNKLTKTIGKVETKHTDTNDETGNR